MLFLFSIVKHNYNLLFATPDMWNLVASNRILDLKWKRKNQQKHIDNLKNIKSQINTSAPKKYSFLNSRPKARQLEYCNYPFYFRKAALN